jgi:hypothetical protein
MLSRLARGGPTFNGDGIENFKKPGLRVAAAAASFAEKFMKGNARDVVGLERQRLQLHPLAGLATERKSGRFVTTRMQNGAPTLTL